MATVLTDPDAPEHDAAEIEELDLLESGAADPPEEESTTTLNHLAAKDLVQLFKLLADETRLRIIHFLMHQDELNVRALCDRLGQSQPAVSHHLALLRVAGLIDSRRDGKHNFYRILPERFQHLLEMIFAAMPDSKGQESDLAALKRSDVQLADAVVSFFRVVT